MDCIPAFDPYFPVMPVQVLCSFLTVNTKVEKPFYGFVS